MTGAMLEMRREDRKSDGDVCPREEEHCRDVGFFLTSVIDGGERVVWQHCL